MKNPVILFSCTGWLHLIFCIWAVRSLRAFQYDPIEIIVQQEWEKAFLEKHLGDIHCTVQTIDIGGYNSWAFKPLPLGQYRVDHTDRDVVVCDTDILWKKNPVPLFERFKGKAWVHKITALNPAELDMVDVLPRRIGLRTMLSYKALADLHVYPNFHVNGGLFMLPREVYSDVMQDWVKKIKMLSTSEMIMTEALLSLTYAEKGIAPASDRADIKYVDLQQDAVSVPVVRFEIAEPPQGMFTGYQTATHYFGNQQSKLIPDAVAMGLDYDNLRFIAQRKIFFKKIKNIRLLPKKIHHWASEKSISRAEKQNKNNQKSLAGKS